MSSEHDANGSDLESFASVLEVGASIRAEDFERHDPPADLWDRISAELGSSGPEAHDAHAQTPTVIGGPSSDQPVASAATGAGAVVQLGPRRRARWLQAAAAAAAVVVAAATVGVVMSTSDDASQELVASVDLEVLQGEATGEAELIRIDGEQRLVISADNMGSPPEGRHYEVWLIDPEITAPQSLGELVLEDGSVSIVVPESLDPADYPIVDINLQEDGVEQHSGLDTSVLRGVLA